MIVFPCAVCQSSTRIHDVLGWSNGQACCSAPCLAKAPPGTHGSSPVDHMRALGQHLDGALACAHQIAIDASWADKNASDATQLRQATLGMAGILVGAAEHRADGGVESVRLAAWELEQRVVPIVQHMMALHEAGWHAPEPLRQLVRASEALEHAPPGEMLASAQEVRGALEALRDGVGGWYAHATGA